jgi:hypothetical protein
MDLTWLYTAAGVLVNNLVLFAWKPLLNSYAGEKGKNLARQEDLERILSEVRAITETQKHIEAKISDEAWHAQWIITERRNAYVSALVAFRAYLQKLDDHVKQGRIVSDNTESAGAELNTASDELIRSIAISELFGGDSFRREMENALRFSNEAANAPDGIKGLKDKVREIEDRLLAIARTDLRIE